MDHNLYSWRWNNPPSSYRFSLHSTLVPFIFKYITKLYTNITFANSSKTETKMCSFPDLLSIQINRTRFLHPICIIFPLFPLAVAHSCSCFASHTAQIHHFSSLCPLFILYPPSMISFEVSEFSLMLIL